MNILQPFVALLVLIWRIYFVLLAIIVTLCIAPLVYFYSFKDTQYPTAWRLMSIWANTLFYGSGMRYILKKELTLNPNQPYVFISNHTSLMDVMLMMILLRKHPSVFIGKKELIKYPLFGRVYAQTSILVDRKDPNSRLNALKQASMRLSEGRSLIIFPEGGVPDDRSIRLAPFKRGAFDLSVRHNTPLAVMTFEGLKRFLPYAYFIGRPGCVKVFMEKIINEGNANQRRQMAFELIYSRLEQEEQLEPIKRPIST